MSGTLTLIFKGEKVNFHMYKDSSEKSRIIQAWERLYTKGMIAKCEFKDDVDAPPPPKVKSDPDSEKSNNQGRRFTKARHGLSTVKINRKGYRIKFPRYDK